MADYCHDWEPGGLGCYPHVPCSHDCLGDFTEMARKWAHKLKDGKELVLGLCEGHGADVYLIKDGGKLYIEHPANKYKEWIPYNEDMDRENRPKRKKSFQMKLVFNLLTGKPKDIESKLIRRLSAYARPDRVRAFKIGMTNHPIRRFAELYAGKYEEMIVLYQTGSVNDVSKLEAIVNSNNREVADNLMIGCGGTIGKPSYYFYVVVSRISRITHNT